VNNARLVPILVPLSALLALAGCGKQPVHQTTPRTINDFSRLNATVIHSLQTPASYQELQDILQFATKNNLKISLAGSRHSQGGQAFYPGAIVISLRKLNKVLALDAQQKLITVQTGATWKEIQEFLQPHGLAVKIMQFANLFTVGGSLSVNCNGIDPHCGPFIESVRSLKILCADDKIRTASRTEHPELFSAAIGGYGLMGIIVEATLEVVEDSFYKRENLLLSLPEYVKLLKTVGQDPQIGFHFAFVTFSLTGTQLFSKVAAFNFKKVDTAKWRRKHPRKRHLFQESFVDIHRISVGLWAQHKFYKALHWVPEGLRHGEVISRNNIMRPPASHLYVELPKSTNLLQEYFIPVDNLMSFVTAVEYITQKLNHNLMHMAFRFIPKNTESLLSYTSTDVAGVVLFFNQPLTPEGNEQTQRWTRYLIDTAIKLGGRHYFPIQLHATKEQVRQAYPQIDKFFRLKRKYDPKEMFANCFYAQYGVR